MSTQMPSLFDELEFFGPKPQREVKKIKKQEKIEKKPIENNEEVDDAVEAEVQKAVAIVSSNFEETAVPIEPAKVEPKIEEKNEEVKTEEELKTETEEKAEKKEQRKEELQEVANSHISFEEPEEESVFFTGNDEIEEEFLEQKGAEIVQEAVPLPIPGLKEEKVDDLDALYRTSIITQDYASFAGLSTEKVEEKERKIEEKGEQSTEAVNEENVQEITNIESSDSPYLKFEFDNEAPNLSEALPEFALEDKYYTIGEVATLFNVNVSHIRFWTSEFKLKVRTTRKGDRLYNPENIARLRLIHHLVKENGFTIKGAKEKLKIQKSNVSAQVDLKEKLTGLREKLERIKRNL